MSDRIPGSSWYNPIWYGKYRIYLTKNECDFEYSFCHDDYDGSVDSKDNRYGYAKSVEDAKEQIKELEA